MPKRSDRKAYSKSFKNNPYQGESPHAMYKRLRWGNKAIETFRFDAPEPMATIGEVAKVRIGKKKSLWIFDENQGPFLAVGRDSNLLYIIPKHSDGSPFNVPSDGYMSVCNIVGIDYFSDKGGDIVYYYHDHENPYPTLMQNPINGCCFLQPAILADGSRSYAVDDAGIIG